MSNAGFGALGLVLDELGREVIGAVCVLLYGPFSTVCIAAAVAWLTGHRLAPVLAMLTLYPARAFSLYLWDRDLFVALVGQGPVAVTEWVVGAVAVLIAGSTLARIDWARTQPVVLVGSFLASGAVAAFFGMGLVLAFHFELTDLLPRLSPGLGGLDREILGGMLFLAAYGLFFFALMLLSAPRSALASAWSGAVLGAGVPGLVGVALLSGTPLRPLLYVAAGVPMVLTAVFALPPCLAGAVVRYLWALSEASGEVSPARAGSREPAPPGPGSARSPEP